MANVEMMPGKKGSPKVPVPEAQDKDLQYWEGRLAQGLEEDPNKQYADSDRRKLAAIRAELKKRGHAAGPANGNGSAPQRSNGGSNGGQRANQPSNALATRNKDTLAAAPVHNPAAVTARLKDYAEKFHLVTPATSCDVLPPGCGVAVSLVYVNASTEKNGPGEVYSVGGGKVGLSGTTLKRVAAAAGIDWDPLRSGRLDSGKDPHYVHYRAVGTVKNFDGSVRTITGEVEIDMREGSPQVIAMESRARDGKNFESQLRDTRLFILRHAETKAKLRAVTDLGIKRSYFPEELQKPFAVPRLMWTGHTDDPELKREAFRMQHAQMAGASAALYGPPGPAQAPVALPAYHGHEPPPLGSVDDDPEDLGGWDYEAAGEAAPGSDPQNAAPQPAASQQQPAAPQQPAQQPASAAPQGDPRQGALIQDGYDRGPDPENY